MIDNPNQLDPQHSSAHPPVLNYRTPGPRTASKVGPFILGFFGALVICGISFFALAATVQESPKLKVIVFSITLIGVVEFCLAPARLAKRAGLIGMGRGVAIGMILGMMALGPCAGCYLTMLYN